MGKKLTMHLDEAETPVVWPDVFSVQETTGPDRLSIAAANPVDLMCSLSQHIGPEYFLLYVLVVSRGEHLVGRYESAACDLSEVNSFLAEYKELLMGDARHQLWVGLTQNKGMLVYETHGLIYAYGPLEALRNELETAGITEGSFSIPSPHSHHYLPEYDSMVSKLFGSRDWIRTELLDGDDE